MRILMDTNVIIHSVSGTLSKLGEDIVDDTSNILYYSSVSIWELAIKHRIGKLKLPVSPGAIKKALDEKGCFELPVTSRHALATSALVSLHEDPFDRMLIAQSLIEDLELVTTDDQLADYAAEVMVV